MKEQEKILIIRFSSIGDIVLTTPVIRCLKTQRPGTEIHYITKAAFKGILENNPNISKVYTIEKNVNEVIEELRKENYSMVIDLHNNLRSAELKLRLRRPAAAFKKLNFRKWLLVNFRLNSMPAGHVVDRYMNTVAGLGIKNDLKGLDYFIPPNDEVVPPFQVPYLAFVIGAKHFTKQLPEEKIISICRRLNKPVVLLGGREDMEKAERISTAAGSLVYSACGKYNLNQSASLLRQAEYVISHDTGLMHIAAALKKKIISVWGNTVPAFGFSPYMAGEGSEIVQVSGLSCRPCSKIGYDKCPKGHFKCMREIDESKFQ